MSDRAYFLTRPAQQTSSVVFASPHSGRDYPRSFLRRSLLDELAIRSSEDAFVDQLISAAPDYGAPLLAARMPRAYVDLNRAAEELDPAIVEDVRPVGHNPRIASGLGVIPRVVANGRKIYPGKIKRDEALTRIAEYWRPYHDMLQSLLDDARGRFGEAILIDFHSMPHEAVDAISPPRGMRPEVILGDRFGASAENEIVERIETVFLESGLRVTRNAPFAGAYIAQHYGRPSRGQHAVQIEIDRALYMNEMHVRPNGNFRSFRSLMNRIVGQIAEIGFKSVPLAAE